MKLGSLFSGIGGIEHGFGWEGGFEICWFIESDSYCQQVLQKITRKFKVEFVSASHQNNGGRINNQFEDLGRARIYEKKTDKFIRRCRVYRNCQTGQLYYQPVQFQKITRKLKVKFIK